MSATTALQPHEAQKGILNSSGAGIRWVLKGIAHHFGNEGVQKVGDAIDKATAAGISWAQIFAALAPLFLSLFTGGGITLEAIIAAITALIPKTA